MSLTDAEFIEQFENCSLDDALFRHDGHLRMAFLYLSRYEPEVAYKRICTGILKFGTSRGAPQKYHETITLAYAKIVASRMHPGESFTEFLAANPDLLTGRALLLEHYSEQRLDSETARTGFVEPDKKPLPTSQ